MQRRINVFNKQNILKPLNFHNSTISFFFSNKFSQIQRAQTHPFSEAAKEMIVNKSSDKDEIEKITKNNRARNTNDDSIQTENENSLFNENLLRILTTNKHNEYLKNFPIHSFNEYDKKILNSFQNKKPTMILSNNNTKSRYLLALGILNKVWENSSDENNFTDNISKEENGLFLSPTTMLKKRKININQQGFGKPRGALIISEKPEISMIYYRIFRLLDQNKLIRLSRIGSSMMAMSPIAEYQDVNYFFIIVNSN